MAQILRSILIFLALLFTVNLFINLITQSTAIFANLLGIILSVLIIAVILAIIILLSPFSYPYFTQNIIITRRRNPKIENLIDEYFIENKFDAIKSHEQIVEQWKRQCIIQIEKSRLKSHRQRQFAKCLDDEHCYNFYLIRQLTTYQQVNYVKYASKVDVIDGSYSFSYADLHNRYIQLYSIGLTSTLSEHAVKYQRSLVTKGLREKIARRDNYTCQICGKYMPDGVGMHIDHIVPVSKGGKSVPSNLQVLCSKCNQSKSNKIQ